MFHTRRNALIHHAGLSYFPLAFTARLPFAMMTVGVLTLVVAERGSLTRSPGNKPDPPVVTG